ncbi:MAG: hypothetical protein AAFX81_02320 [Pseudomonadota bacterium]
MRSLVTLLALTLPATALAQPASVERGPWGALIQGGYVHQFDSDIDGGGSFSVDRFFVEGGPNYSFDRRTSVGLNVAYGYDGYDFSSDGAGSFTGWDSVNEVRVGVPVRFGIGERVNAFVAPQLRMTAESGADFGSGATGGAVAGFSYTFGERLSIGPGIGVFSQIEDSVAVFPILLVDWKITDTLSLETGQGLGATRGPGLVANWQPIDDWTFGVGARYESFQFRLADGGVGRERAFPVFFTAGYSPMPLVSGALVVGADVGGELTRENGFGQTVEREDFDPAPFVGVTFRGRF